jgi:hypothetical protein
MREVRGHFDGRDGRGAVARTWSGLAAVTLPILVMSAACADATGMGFYQSCDANVADKATFGFSWQSDGHFQGAYHDPAGSTNIPTCRPVKLKGDGNMGTFVGTCPVDPPQTSVNFMMGTLKYTSQDPNVPDCVPTPFGGCEDNLLTLTVCDTGHNDPATGQRVGDFIMIDIISGPFAPYHNEGFVEGGNITVHDRSGTTLSL